MEFVRFATMLRMIWKTVRNIVLGYSVVAAFLALFLLWLRKGERCAPGLSDPKWALLIATILVLPVLLPLIKEHLLPYIRSIKIAEFLEISIREAEVSGHSSEEITQRLQQISAGDITVSQYVNAMYSESQIILDVVKTLQKSKEEVLVVDFQKGQAWIPPNLYFLALMARYYTRVRQIVFVETREAPQIFVGTSSPEELEEVLGTRFPIFRMAAVKCDHQQRTLGMNPNGKGVGRAFFEALMALYSVEDGAEQVRNLWLNSTRLAEHLDAFLHPAQISWREKLTLDDYRQVLTSFQPYVAIVKNGQLDSFVSRDRLALRAARVFVERSSA